MVVIGRAYPVEPVRLTGQAGGLKFVGPRGGTEAGRPRDRMMPQLETQPLRDLRPPRDAESIERALVIADAGWFTTASLFSELDRSDTATLLLTCLDWRNAWRRGQRPWSWNQPPTRTGNRHWKADLALPAGWMKTYPRIGMRPIAKLVWRWRREVAPRARLTLVMTYPHYLALRDMVEPEDTIYLNVDDYRLYWPRHAGQIAELERRAVVESNLTACVAWARSQELRDAVPEARGRIVHLPHGAPRATIPDRPHPRPAAPPADLAAIAGPRLGYVGSLEDRLDWSLLDQLAEHRPDAAIVLIGRPEPGIGGEGWQQRRQRCLARSNVHLLGWRDQSVLGDYIASFDACLIPYAVDHPFNRACNPTKIMDYMGSGRPIVATDLPECRLHVERMHVTDGVVGFLAAVDAIVAAHSDDGRADARHAFAAENRCGIVAAQLINRLEEALAGPSTRLSGLG